MDLQATGANPGTEYLPALGPPTPPYNEDRQVTLAGGPTQVYRTYNAHFLGSPQQWAAVDTTKPAYANVQSPDGSIHYYALDTTTGLWEGSGNNTVYNGVDFGMSPANADNTSFLQKAIDAVFSGIAGGPPGGVIFIPAGLYEFAGTVNFTGTSGNDPGIIIAGVGGGTELRQTANQHLFDISGCTSGNGIRFKDVTFSFETGGPGHLTGTVISVTSSQNVTCERVYFHDCPTAMADDIGSSQCGLFDCLIYYTKGISNTTMVTLSGSQDFIDECVMLQTPEGTPGVPTNVTGIAIGTVATSYVTNTHVNSFHVGITIGDGATDAFFSNVRVDAFHKAVAISQGSRTIFGVFFSGCTFGLGNNSTEQTSGITLDAAVPAELASVFFNNCTAYGWENAGIQINAGQNIVIVGGQYSSNGQNPQSVQLGAGIAITSSNATDVTITGVDCSGVYELWPKIAMAQPAVTQPYGVAVSGGGTATISACTLAGNATGALYASAPGTLEVTNCAGYNDQGTIVSNTAPPNGTQFNGTYSSFSTPYFGPVTFYVKSGTGLISHIKLNGHDTNLTSGTFSLGPGAWTAEIDYTGVPFFLMIGQ